jgi:predicted DNA-binding transcriptional regulator AlpA
MSSIKKKASAAQGEDANKAAATAAASQVRLISKPEVLDRVGRTFPTIWLWMREGKFPRARDLGGRPAWIESEVEEWIAALPVRRLKGDEVA